MNINKGRPKKKPTYSEEMIMQELLSAISDAYLTGSNGKGETSLPAVSLRQVANEFDITLMKARKLLITAGVYHTEISDKVNELKAEGKTIEQIMELTGLKRSSVHSYLPYTKSIYNLKELSLYAERCRLYRARKKAVEYLRELESDSSIEDRLWDAIRIFAGYRFTTAKSLVFRYTVQLLRKRIKDEAFISLMWKFLRAGYMEQWTYHETYSGSPQGSGVSPILANIYLNELDEFMARMKKSFDKGDTRSRKVHKDHDKVSRYWN